MQQCLVRQEPHTKAQQNLTIELVKPSLSD